MFTQKYHIGEPVFVVTTKSTGKYSNTLKFCTITKSVVVDILYNTKYHNANFDPKTGQKTNPADIVIDSVKVKYKVAHRVETIDEEMVFHSLEEAENHIKDHILFAFYKDAIRYNDTSVENIWIQATVMATNTGNHGVIIYNQENI